MPTLIRRTARSNKVYVDHGFGAGTPDGDNEMVDDVVDTPAVAIVGGDVRVWVRLKKKKRRKGVRKTKEKKKERESWVETNMTALTQAEPPGSQPGALREREPPSTEQKKWLTRWLKQRAGQR